MKQRERERYKKRIIAMRGKGQWEKHEGHSIHHAYDSLMLPYIPERFFVEWGCDRTRVTREKKNKERQQWKADNKWTKQSRSVSCLSDIQMGVQFLWSNPETPRRSKDSGGGVLLNMDRGWEREGREGENWQMINREEKGRWLPNVSVWDWFREGCPILFFI